MKAIIRGYRPLFRGLVRRLCGLVNDVVAISPALYHDTLDVVAANRVHFIPQGVVLPRHDPRARSMARQRLGFTEDDTVLLFIGGICARKDVRFLVENHPAELGRLHLLLVGPFIDAPYLADLRQAIAASPAAERIMLAGYMDDPAPAFHAADAFVFASRKEGFGNVLIEAMAHGLPVICRRLANVTDSFIEHGRTGLLFQTASGYQGAVRLLARDRERRAALGATARAAIVGTYDLDTVAGQYAALYRKG